MRGGVLEVDDLVSRQFAYDLARRADDQHMVGKQLPFGNQGLGADDAALADHGAVEDHRADSDQAAVADRATMQHDEMADGHVGAYAHRHALVGMQHRAVLDVAVVADVDRVIVAAQRGVPPDRGVGAEMDVADHRGVGGNPGVFAGLRRLVSETEEGHSDSFAIDSARLYLKYLC